MKSETTEVTVGRMRIRVPTVVDEETTQRIAEQVNTRLQEIDSKSARIDSLQSALAAAMSFAAELETVRLDAAEEHEQSVSDHADEQREFFQALHRIADAIRQEPQPES